MEAQITETRREKNQMKTYTDKYFLRSNQIMKAEGINVIDLSAYSQVSGNWNIKALVAGIICNKLLADRIIYRKN